MNAPDTALFHLLYAVNGSVHQLRNGLGFGDTDEVES